VEEKPVFQRAYPVLAILAVVCYVAAVLIGGLMVPGYSHLYNTISELTASDQPRRLVLDGVFTAYNLLLMLFALGGLAYFQPRREALGRAVFVLLIISALLGLGMSVFPQDPRAAAMTDQGRLHILLAGLTAPLTLAIAFLMGLCLWRDYPWHAWAVYSWVITVQILAFGGLTAVAVAANSAWGGLLERLTIGSFLEWLVAIAWVAWNKSATELRDDPRTMY
jgi:hypothetical membrane protein